MDFFFQTFPRTCITIPILLVDVHQGHGSKVMGFAQTGFQTWLQVCQKNQFSEVGGESDESGEFHSRR